MASLEALLLLTNVIWSMITLTLTNFFSTDRNSISAISSLYQKAIEKLSNWNVVLGAGYNLAVKTGVEECILKMKHFTHSRLLLLLLET